MLLAWCCIVRAGRISVAILENTIGFDTSVLQDCLGDAYDMVTLRVDPRHAGFAVTNRPRIYVVLVRKGRVRITHDMQQVYTEVSNIVSSNSIHNISDAMLSSEAELVAVENATRKRLRLAKVTRRSPSWAYLLTRKQREYLDIYTKQWKHRRGIDATSDLQCYFDLGQNPRYERGSRDRMPAFRTGCYRLWVLAQGRWLLPREVGACMGWPSFVGLPCPLLGHELPEELFRSGFLGNGMHLGNVGMVVATALSCLELEPDVWRALLNKLLMTAQYILDLPPQVLLRAMHTYQAHTLKALPHVHPFPSALRMKHTHQARTLKALPPVHPFPSASKFV